MIAMLLRCLLCGLLFVTTVLPEEPIRITIHAEGQMGQPIPSTVFGSFLEPIGNSTYNGLWAEIVQNPSFESGLWSARAMREMLTSDPQLVQASQVALPLPWEPLHPEQGNRYEPIRGDAANSYESLAVYGLPDHEVGVRQEVYLPVHRELTYRGSFFVKLLSGSGLIRASLRKRNQPDAILASAEFRAHAGGWQKYAFDLAVKPRSLKPLEPADLVIATQDSERIIIDQASLMPADSLDGLDPDMVQMSKDMHTPLVRFGGNFTSAYHWRDGVGPMDKRISVRNVAWGIPETNQFGTDEFLNFCRRIGAQPQIALNLGTGTAEEAADWVRYVDQHWTTHTGLLWELGNELWGNWNDAYPTLEELAERTLRFSRAVRQADPQSRLIATGQDPDRYQAWNARQLRNPPDVFDFLSTHFVVRTNELAGADRSPDAIALDNFALPVALERKLRDMKKQMDNAGHSAARIAFTEWLFHSGNADDAPGFQNLGGAITAGGFLNMLLRNSSIVPISDMTGIIEFAGIWKKRSQVFATPSYYAFKMFSTADPATALHTDNSSPTYDVHGGISRLPDISNVPFLDAVAVRNAKGTVISLFCVNRKLREDLSAEISIAGAHALPHAEVQELFAQGIYASNDELHPATIRPSQSSLEVTNLPVKFVFRRASVTRIDFKLD